MKRKATAKEVEAVPSEPTAEARSVFVSDWVKSVRPPYRRCGENGCKGRVYYCADEWAGDASWAIYQCDLCGAGFKQAGVWSYRIPVGGTS